MKTFTATVTVTTEDPGSAPESFLDDLKSHLADYATLDVDTESAALDMGVAGITLDWDSLEEVSDEAST